MHPRTDDARLFEVTAVTRRPEKDNWIYIAHLSDSEPVVIRTSKHIYDTAYQYSEPVAGGNKTGLRRFFTFGALPDRYYREHLIRPFEITQEV